MRLRDGMIRHPMLRVDLSDQSERHATWLELFYDLAYVAAIGALAAALKDSFTFEGFGKFAILMIPIWWAWVGHTFYLSRFDSDDLIHRLLGLIQIIGAVSLAIQVPAAMEGQTEAFSIAYACVRLVLVGQYFYAAIKNPSSRALTVRWGLGFSVGAAVWAASAWLQPPIAYAAWALAIVIELLTPFFNRSLPIKIPPNYTHISERLGLFTIIVLGETILAAASGVRFSDLTPASGGALILGLVMAFLVWWVYFEGVRGHEVTPPTQPKHVRKMQFWLYSHLPLAAGIVVSSVGVKKIMAGDLMQPVEKTVAQLFGLGIVLAALSLHAIWYAGLKPQFQRYALRLSLPHVAITLGMCIASLMSPFLPALAWTGLMIAALSLHMVLDLFGESETERIARLDPHEPMAQPFCTGILLA